MQTQDWFFLGSAHHPSSTSPSTRKALKLLEGEVTPPTPGSETPEWLPAGFLEEGKEGRLHQSCPQMLLGLMKW